MFEYFNKRSETLKDIFNYLYDKKSAEVQAAIAHIEASASEVDHFADIDSIQF